MFISLPANRCTLTHPLQDSPAEFLGYRAKLVSYRPRCLSPSDTQGERHRFSSCNFASGVPSCESPLTPSCSSDHVVTAVADLGMLFEPAHGLRSDPTPLAFFSRSRLDRNEQPWHFNPLHGTQQLLGCAKTHT
jgi:hypothetical protein